jgi:hypothetical protein
MKARGAIGDEWWQLMPPGTSADAARILLARGLRAFGDGFVALLVPIYLLWGSARSRSVPSSPAL